VQCNSKCSYWPGPPQENHRASSPHELLIHAEEDNLLEPLLYAFCKVFADTPPRARLKSCGDDRVTLCAFCQERLDRLAELSAAMCSATYRRQSLKPMKVTKPSGKERLLHIPSVRDRVCARMVLEAIQPKIDPRLSNGCRGGRPGLPLASVIRDVDSALASGRVCAARTDIQSYFDEIPREHLDPMLCAEIDCPFVEDMAFELLGPPGDQARGVPQGIGLSTLAANLYLRHADETMVRSGVFYIRYVDDILILTTSLKAAARAFRKTRRLVEEAGLLLHPPESNKTIVAEVGGAEAVEFLGFELTRQGARVPVSRLRQMRSSLSDVERRARRDTELGLIGAERLVGTLAYFCTSRDVRVHELADHVRAVHARLLRSSP